MLSGAVAWADIDFTPHDSFYLAETTKVPCVAFRKGDDPVSYSPPFKWSLSGGGNQVTLTPAETPQAGAVMQTAPVRSNLIPATEENIKVYTDMAVRRLPRESSKVTLVEAKIADLQFSGRKMVEVTLTYVAFAQPFTTNVLFLPYDKELITFQMTARTPDFAPLARLFRASLFSITGL